MIFACLRSLNVNKLSSRRATVNAHHIVGQQVEYRESKIRQRGIAR